MTAVPATLYALTDHIANQSGLGDVQVRMGAPIDLPDAPDSVQVGYSPEESGVQYTLDNAGLAQEAEEFDVFVLVSCNRGGTTRDAHRSEGLTVVIDRCDQIVETIRAALKADPRLGGRVERARFTAMEFEPIQTQSGAGCSALITVHVRARRDSR